MLRVREVARPVAGLREGLPPVAAAQPPPFGPPRSARCTRCRPRRRCDGSHGFARSGRGRRRHPRLPPPGGPRTARRDAPSPPATPLRPWPAPPPMRRPARAGRSPCCRRHGWPACPSAGRSQPFRQRAAPTRPPPALGVPRIPARGAERWQPHILREALRRLSRADRPVARQRDDLPAHEALCQAMNPGIPVKVFRLSGGVSDIGEAQSADGKRYRSLPMAYAFETTKDGRRLPSRHRPGGRAPRLLLRDFTLRPGDSVVLDGKVRTFMGGSRFPYSPRDFRDFARRISARASAARSTSASASPASRRRRARCGARCCCARPACTTTTSPAMPMSASCCAVRSIRSVAAPCG